MFPTSVEGTIDIWANSADAALNRLTEAITAQGATHIKRRPEELAFRGTFRLPVPTLGFQFRISTFEKNRNLNPLFMFDRCVISAQDEKLRYKCSTKFVLVLVTVMTMLVWFAMLTASQSIPLPILLIAPLLIWLFNFGFAYVASRNRFRQFLEDVVWGPEASKK